MGVLASIDWSKGPTTGSANCSCLQTLVSVGSWWLQGNDSNLCCLVKAVVVIPSALVTWKTGQRIGITVGFTRPMDNIEFKFLQSL